MVFLYLDRGDRNESNHSINQTKDRISRRTFLRRNTSQKAFAALAWARDRSSRLSWTCEDTPRVDSCGAGQRQQAIRPGRSGKKQQFSQSFLIAPSLLIHPRRKSKHHSHLTLSLCFYFSSFHPRSISLTAPAPGLQPSKCSPPGWPNVYNL